MRAISLWQPWASLFVGRVGKPGPKRFETRHWPTHYRGWLLIHAAQRKVPLAEIGPELLEVCTRHGYTSVPHGALLGAVLIDHCQHIDKFFADQLRADDRDSIIAGDFRAGRFAWRRSAAVALLEPIPYRGQQGFFEVPEATLPLDFFERLRAA